LAGFRLISVLLTALCASAVTALTVTVTAPAAQTPTAITANARRIDGDIATTRELQLAIGGSTPVDLTEGTWEITTTDNRFWAAPLYVSGSDAATLRLWPRGAIGGTVGARSPASGDLVVHFAFGETKGSVVCPVADRNWACSLPAGEMDLRFDLTGFATEFRWNVKVADGSAPVALDFTPGSSVFGKVALTDSELLRTAEVSLTPSNLDDARGNVPHYTAKPDARGFFQVRGLAPGRYGIHAAAGNLISETRTVEIIAQTNAALKEPLVLAKPGRLSVKITPALDLEQKPWQVMLLFKKQGAANLDVISRSLALPDGTWSHQRVLPGDYSLVIQQEDGGEWKTEKLTIGREDRSLDIVLAKQQVSGKVTLGKRPIGAKVRFGGENGPGFIADEDGRFAGAIPPVEHDEATLLVTSDTPDIQRTLVMKGDRSPDGELQFDIALPATTLVGRTLNEDGSPERYAIVTLRSKDDRIFEQMFSKEDGSFQFEGFDAGMYALQAEAYEKASAVIYVEARGEDSSPTDLILRPEEQVRGRIFMKGAPVAGADVYAMPRDTKASLLPTVTSDATGRFVVTLPPRTGIYDVIVIPRGFYVTSARVTRDPKEGLRVEVDQNGGALSVDAPDDETMMLLGHAGGEYSLSWLAWKTEGVTVRENGRQRLTIPNLEPGPYSVCRKQTCRSVYVPPFATASVSLD
jgi:hypothetical protein